MIVMDEYLETIEFLGYERRVARCASIFRQSESQPSKAVVFRCSTKLRTVKMNVSPRRAAIATRSVQKVTNIPFGRKAQKRTLLLADVSHQESNGQAQPPFDTLGFTWKRPRFFLYLHLFIFPPPPANSVFSVPAPHSGTRSETGPEDVLSLLHMELSQERKTEYFSSGVFERSSIGAIDSCTAIQGEKHVGLLHEMRRFPSSDYDTGVSFLYSSQQNKKYFWEGNHSNH